MNKTTASKSKRNAENVAPSDHALVRLLIAEHTALAKEMLHLVRDIRKHVSLVSALVDAKNAGAALRAWERPCPPFKT